MRPIINYKENDKIRIVRSDSSFDKHEIVKLIICLLSRRKYRDSGVYTEYELPNGDRPDVCIDFGSEKVYYEIQKEISPKWLESIKNRDLNLNVNTIVIPLKDLSDNLPELIKQLGGLIV